MRIRSQIIALVVLILALLPLNQTNAQASNSRFFPETGRTISGRFFEYWQNNGGLAVFGLPLTEQYEENDHATQYFERQRFELHPENARPYDVLLGRLGAELLERQGMNGQTQAAPPNSTPGCIYFDATQHNVCNQQGNTGFLSYWQNNGLEFDGRRGKSYAESLALFGYPLTEVLEYTNSSGDKVQAQWFERARFEWHPNNPNPYKVLLGRLGAEWQQNNPNPPLVSRIKIHLIALEDNGQSGKQIGCGDSVIPVQQDIEPTTMPLNAALTKLFANKDQFYGESGLYNALYQSNLRVDSATITQGRATVTLSGQLMLNGVCDNPRVQAQIEETIRQFSSITSADIFLNGVPLADALSER